MAALFHNNEVLLAGYEAMVDGILITDTHQTLVFFNQAGSHIFHFDEGVLHTDIEELWSQSRDLKIHHESFHDIIEKITKYPDHDLSFDFSCTTGEKRMSTKPLSGTGGDILGRIWIISDIPRDSPCSFRTEHEDGLFKSIFNLIPQGIALSDLNTGHFYEVNKHFTKQWGYTREEVIGKSAVDLDFWVDITQRNNIVELMKKDGSFSLIPVKMRGKDKKVKDILFSGVMVPINNRSYMLSIPLDITDIITYEEKIWSLASFIELNPNPIFEMNEEGIITSNNQATLSVIKKFTGTTDLSLIIPDNLEEILEAIRSGREMTFHREISLSDHYFHEYIYITNQYRSARVYVSDVTEQKIAEHELLRKNEELGAAYEEILSAEEELRENYEILKNQEHSLFNNEKKLRMIVDHIPGIVLTTDTDMIIRSIYGEGLIHLGISSDEGVGKKIDTVFHQADHLLLNAHYQALDGIISTVEGSFENRRFVLFTSPLRDVSDTITGTLGVAIDIEDQKNLEEERKQLLLQLEQNLIELALLNDKIRNPLSVISTLVEIHAPTIEESITGCVQDIDDIIHNLDKRWVDSEKTLHFLQKHYDIGLHMTSNQNPGEQQALNINNDL